MKVQASVLAVFLLTAATGPGKAEELSFPFESKESLAGWIFTQPDRWTWTDGTLHLLGVSSQYKPPHRSPHSIALLKDRVFGDFVLTARVKTLQTSRGHRDMCLFFGWQDPANFYYVHLGEKVDPNSSQVFIVKNAPRTPITKENSGGIPWKDDTWHEVKLVREAESGRIDVFFDDMTKPAKSAVDKTFAWGMIGLGSFDDLGQWDEVRINGTLLSGKTPVLPVPAEAPAAPKP